MSKGFWARLLGVVALIAAYQATNSVWGIVAIAAMGLAALLAAVDVIEYEKEK